MSQRNVPPEPPANSPGTSSAPPEDRESQPTSITTAPRAPLTPSVSVPTPTNAFTTAEIEAAQAQANAQLPSRPAAGNGPSMPPPLPPARPVSLPPPPPRPSFSASGAHPSVTPPPPFVAPSAVGQGGGPLAAQLAQPPLPVAFTSSAPYPIVSPSQLSQPQPTSAVQPISLRADLPRDVRAAAAHVTRSRAYAFVLDARGAPIEVGSGRFAKAYLGEERWLESKTDFRRPVVIKILQKGVSEDDRMRFQIEKELLERVQGHPNIITLYASGESDDPEFVPAAARDKVENDFMVLERLDMSLEERLKGSRVRGKRDDLLASDMRERLFKVLDYMIPVTSAVEYAHLVRNICHRDIKPANILIGLPDTTLRGSTLEVRLADFNVAKLHDEDVSFGMTQMKSVPGTLFFQSPEQETNVLELLVNVAQGSPEVEFFEDFYIQIAKNDSFSLFNRGESYAILYADRAKKKIVLDRPYRDISEANVRAKVQKSVGRPADIYSLGALFYYLISGAYANPKALYDAFHKFIEYEHVDENNTIEAYLAHEYSVIDSLRAPKTEQGVNVAPADRFFSYKHYLDGNGDLIDFQVMRIIAKCMIRNKPDSYCQAHEIETRGISDLAQDLIDLYAHYGFQPSPGSTQLARRGHVALGKSNFRRRLDRFGLRLRRIWMWFATLLGKKR